MITRNIVSLFGKFILCLPYQIVFGRASDAYLKEISGHQGKSGVYKDKPVYVRAVHIGTSNVGM